MQITKIAALPQNIEAEQQLIGAMLLENGIVHRIGIDAADFADPIHARVFEVIKGKVERDEVASPVTIRALVEDDLREVGGAQYLARMAAAAISAKAAPDYARMIKDCATRRNALTLIRDAEAALVRGADAAGDVLGRLEAALAAIGPSDSKMRPVSLLEAAVGAVRQIDDAFHGRVVPGLCPPWRALSGIVPAFRAGDMVVLAGRPSMGKSAVALAMATAAAHDGHPVVIASLEMSPEDMALRALSEATSQAGRAVSYSSMANGAIRDDEYRQTLQAAKAIQNLPVSFLTQDFSKSGAIFSGVKKALRAMPSGKTPLIVIDYMQLMDGAGRDLREQMTDVSKQVKRLARSCNAVVISLSQLSREVEKRQDKRPMLSDLRETGQIEQDADAVIFCYRDEYYLEREPEPAKEEDRIARADRLQSARNRLELIVAKQRRGPIGTAQLFFAPAFNRIWE